MEFIHCIIDRKATSKLEPEVHKVLQDVINVFNYMKIKPLNSRFFTIICNDMGSDQEKSFVPCRGLLVMMAKCLEEL